MHVVVTGGAGFIGSHITDLLVTHGHSVTVLDLLLDDAHPTGRWPDYTNPGAQYIQVDIRDTDALRANIARA